MLHGRDSPTTLPCRGRRGPVPTRCSGRGPSCHRCVPCRCRGVSDAQGTIGSISGAVWRYGDCRADVGGTMKTGSGKGLQNTDYTKRRPISERNSTRKFRAGTAFVWIGQAQVSSNAIILRSVLGYGKDKGTRLESRTSHIPRAVAVLISISTVVLSRL